MVSRIDSYSATEISITSARPLRVMVKWSCSRATRSASSAIRAFASVIGMVSMTTILTTGQNSDHGKRQPSHTQQTDGSAAVPDGQDRVERRLLRPPLTTIEQLDGARGQIPLPTPGLGRSADGLSPSCPLTKSDAPPRITPPRSPATRYR